MKSLHYFNLLGVLVLAGLCAAQWQVNRRLNVQARDSERIRIEQEERIKEQDKAVKGLSADLDSFKEQFTRANILAEETSRKVIAAERGRDQIERERDQLRESITNWVNAVAIRDERIQEANEKIRKLADDLNASIDKHNQLILKYNALVEAASVTTNRAASLPPK